MEIWRNIKNYEGLYQISNLGRVKSLNYHREGKDQILKSYIDTREGKGYYRVTLCKNGKTKRFQVHRLVAETFIPNPLNLPQINHKNEDKSLNVVENLEWCTAKYNMNYGTAKQRIGKSNSKTLYQMDKETNEVIAEFPSTQEVERKFGYCSSLISRCCKDQTKSAYGFKWRYKNG